MTKIPVYLIHGPRADYVKAGEAEVQEVDRKVTVTIEIEIDPALQPLLLEAKFVSIDV